MTDPTSTAQKPIVSLTTDIGEGFGMWELGDDEALLAIVTSANVACGFHGGDPDIMRRTCETAVRNRVSIGAQVSYRDLVGFGRRYLAVSRATLANDLLYQIGALEAFARVAGTQIAYVRAHGALYNVAAKDAEHAAAIIDAVQLYDASLPVLCQPNTVAWELGEQAGINLVAEAFVDRAYTPEGLLVPRGVPGARLSDPKAAAERAVAMVFEGKVTTLDGASIPIKAESLLVHCDTPGAVEFARATRDALTAAGAKLVPQS